MRTPQIQVNIVSVEARTESRVLELAFDDGQAFSLPFEFLRVYSPSAEVQGHGQPILQTGKRNVGVIGIEPIGHYAIKLLFDDGHQTGIFSWDYLYHLGLQHAELWQDYLAQLQAAGFSAETGRDVAMVARTKTCGK